MLKDARTVHVDLLRRDALQGQLDVQQLLGLRPLDVRVDVDRHSVGFALVWYERLEETVGTLLYQTFSGRDATNGRRQR